MTLTGLLMEGLAGSGTHEFNDTPEQESWSAFPPQYADTGFKELQGGFGSFAANGTCIFRLGSQQVVSSGGVQLVPSDIVVQLDGSGNIPSGVYLYLSTDLAPFSIYVVTVLDSRGKQIFKTDVFVLRNVVRRLRFEPPCDIGAGDGSPLSLFQRSRDLLGGYPVAQALTLAKMRATNSHHDRGLLHPINHWIVLTIGSSDQTFVDTLVAIQMHLCH